MSTNVFSTTTMTAGAAATLGNRHHHGHHHHHHNHHRQPHHSVANQSTMLFTPVAVSGSAGNTPIGPSANSPTTAFPFPPPSPLFLSSLSLLQNAHQQQQQQHLQQLSPWLTAPGAGPLSALAAATGTLNLSPKCAPNELSDNNNNELIGSTTSTSRKICHRSMIEENEIETKNRAKESFEQSHKSAFERKVDRLPYSPPPSCKSQANHCRIDNWPENSDYGKSSPKEKEPKMIDSSNSQFKTATANTSAFLLPSFNGNPVPSPTFAMGLRPASSPHTPTNAFGYAASHYLLPPHMFPYYQQQAPAAAAAAAASHSYSPTSQSSPISPFLVPNLSQSPSMISTTTTTNKVFDPYSENEAKQSECKESKHETNTVIDLSKSNSPVDCRKLSSPSKSTSAEQVTSLKRKSPVDDESPAKANDNGGGGGVQSPERKPEVSGATPRKFHLMKPPNINISECDYRNGFGSAFLPSPLFPHHYSSHLPASPYAAAAAAAAAYLDHIPLSAPPIPASHQNNSSKCFDFSPVQSDTFTFTPPHQHPGKDSLSLHLMNQINSSTLASSSSQFAKAKCSTANSQQRTEMLNSIMKEKRKQQQSQCSSSSESRVTFQVPHPLSKLNHDIGENRKAKAVANGKLHKVAATSMLASSSSSKWQQPQQPYPEYFRKGSTIKLGNGGLKKVEELSTEDFTESACVNGSRFKVELSEVISIKEKSKKGIVRICFLVGQSQVKVMLDSPIEHPFFVYQKSWRSCSPAITAKRYGLTCDRLLVGDTVVTLANRPSTTPVKVKTPRSLSSSSSGSVSSSSSSPTIITINHRVMKYPAPPAAHTTNSVSHTATTTTTTVATECALNLDVKNQSLRKEDEDEEIDVEKVDDEDDAGRTT